MVRLFLCHIAVFLARSWPRNGSAPVSCSQHAEIKCTEQVSMRRKDLSQVSLQFTHEFVTVTKFLQSFNVVSKLFCPWSGVGGQIIPCSSYEDTCPDVSAQQSLLNLLVEKVTLQNLILHSLGPANSTNSECHRNRHCPKLSVRLFVRDLFSFLVQSQFLLVTAKSPSRQRAQDRKHCLIRLL